MSAGVPVRKPPAFTASSMRGNVVVAASCGSLIAALGNVKLEPQRKALAELELDAAARIGGLEADHVPLDGAALGGAATDDAADAVLGHEVEGPLRAALDRLPAFDRQALRRRH